MGKKKAVLIGCNYPGTQAALNGCINDVWGMKEILEQYLGFSSSDILVMIDTDKQYLQPTGKNMREKISQLINEATDDDVIFLHYSGHGTQVPSTDSKELDRKNEAICPTDMNVITDKELVRMCAPLNSKPNVKFTFVADCCHSGTMLDHEQVIITGAKPGGPPPPAIDPASIQAMLASLGAGPQREANVRNRALPFTATLDQFLINFVQNYKSKTPEQARDSMQQEMGPSPIIGVVQNIPSLVKAVLPQLAKAAAASGAGAAASAAARALGGSGGGAAGGDGKAAGSGGGGGLGGLMAAAAGAAASAMSGGTETANPAYAGQQPAAAGAAGGQRDMISQIMSSLMGGGAATGGAATGGAAGAAAKPAGGGDLMSTLSALMSGNAAGKPGATSTMGSILSSLMGGGGPAPNPNAKAGEPGSGLGALLSAFMGGGAPAAGGSAPAAAGAAGGDPGCMGLLAKLCGAAAAPGAAPAAGTGGAPAAAAAPAPAMGGAGGLLAALLGGATLGGGPAPSSQNTFATLVPPPGSEVSLGKDAGILVTGCMDKETSADACPSGDKAKAHGALSNALQTIIKSHNAQNPGQPLTYRNLVVGVRDMLAKQRFAQNPCLECDAKYADTPFVLQGPAVV
mmetsp:Transcript_36126/g.80399  ORF Transcript_36126/g.80399 Transcript_36126/m.80399 type:complete len:628 (-) Transcript_36126:943-2826(-)|eukprot:CAMPEP_0202890748 /NCGR_PEP_ID=MMETSP1392-20130828/1058_1 /ASSEMBLY_ACC=CAM_ASM_000868 /TAXON_ID=225041 /ORGANISM="Chlamydomonas chlamydogama, Strain SAG 11-48b" /LENGTH=627 /DNA_ID=CAMNT_0049574375 /DNA_START=125 /DNA_END=2008 /DNA_ORIENTATION=-